MNLKQKLFYAAVGAILLAACQISFELWPKPALADSHQSQDTLSERPPVKWLLLINYPLGGETGGKNKYLRWVKAVGSEIAAPEEVTRVRSYDNFGGTNPHRLVEVEFNSLEELHKYQRRPEIQSIMQSLSNYSSSSSDYIFVQRSDYVRLNP